MKLPYLELLNSTETMMCFKSHNQSRIEMMHGAKGAYYKR